RRAPASPPASARPDRPPLALGISSSPPFGSNGLRQASYRAVQHLRQMRGGFVEGDAPIRVCKDLAAAQLDADMHHAVLHAALAVHQNIVGIARPTRRAARLVGLGAVKLRAEYALEIVGDLDRIRAPVRRPAAARLAM